MAVPPTLLPTMAYIMNVPSLNTSFPNIIPQRLLEQYPTLSQDVHAGDDHCPSDATEADDVAIILS
jgi:hypothetical protein